jgi:hypothetical protein
MFSCHELQRTGTNFFCQNNAFAAHNPFVPKYGMYLT